MKKYPILKELKLYLNNLKKPIFVRMTGSGSALVSYYSTKNQCNPAQKSLKKIIKNTGVSLQKTI